MARETMDLGLRLLKESNRSKFDSYSVRNSVLIISYITFRDYHVHIFSDNLSRNGCIIENSEPLCPSQKSWEQRKRMLWLSRVDRIDPAGPSSSTLQVATILVAMAPKILRLATWFVTKISLNQKNWSPNGD